MNWHQLQSTEQLDEILDKSKEQDILIFKHSTRCSISSTALDRLERAWEASLPIEPYYLDLIAYREVSNRIADKLGVVHQSPQILLIRDGKCVFDESHFGINVAVIKEQLVS